MDQILNVTINQSLFCLLFSHESIVYINVTLKVKTVLMFFFWIASISVQPETAIDDIRKSIFFLNEYSYVFVYVEQSQNVLIVIIEMVLDVIAN